MSYKIYDYRDLKWGYTKSTPGSAGSLYKTDRIEGDTRVYYKLSTYYENGVFNVENIMEIIATRVANILGIECVQYNLRKANIILNNQLITTYIVCSKNYKKQNEVKQNSRTFYDLNKEENETVTNFYIRAAGIKWLAKLFIFDYIICNRDRHESNLEVLKNGNAYRMSPLYDNGLSLLTPITPLGQWKIEKPQNIANNFLGERNLKTNVDYILNILNRKSIKIPLTFLEDKHKKKIFWALKEPLFDIFKKLYSIKDDKKCEEEVDAYINELWNILKERSDYVKCQMP